MRQLYNCIECLDLVQENVQLRADLKMCAKALKSQPHAHNCCLNGNRPFGDKAREEYDKLQCNCFKSVLNNPRIQAILNEKDKE